MQVRVFKDAQAVAKAAAMIFAAQLAEKSDSVLGLPRPWKPTGR